MPYWPSGITSWLARVKKCGLIHAIDVQRSIKGKTETGVRFIYSYELGLLLNNIVDRMSAGVHDGVTVRHVACSVHGCTNTLLSQRDLYCYTHRDLLKVCCIRGCLQDAEPGFRTCQDVSHRAFQTTAEQKNTAMFQLHSRLRQAGISQVPRAGEIDLDEDNDPVLNEGEEDEEDNAAGTASGQQPRLKGRIYRNWTHNEQLFVRCCGVIISRATFFGSEGVSGINVSSI